MRGKSNHNSARGITVSFSSAILLALCLPALCLPTLSAQILQPFDLLITGGRIIDGAGNPWVRGSVGILGDRIACDGASARR